MKTPEQYLKYVHFEQLNHVWATSSVKIQFLLFPWYTFSKIDIKKYHLTSLFLYSFLRILESLVTMRPLHCVKYFRIWHVNWSVYYRILTKWRNLQTMTHILPWGIVAKFNLLYYANLSKLTRNAMRCNNRDDLLHLSFTLKISILSEAYT